MVQRIPLSTITLKAIEDFAEQKPKEKKYLKIEYDEMGNRCVTCLKKSDFTFRDTLQWLFVPSKWSRFNLDSIAEVCQAAIGENASKLAIKHVEGISNLNSKIDKHNNSLKHRFWKIFNVEDYMGVTLDPKQVEAIFQDTISPAKNTRSKVHLENKIGISNAGNTCYQNSLLQALRASQAFKKIYTPDKKTLTEPFKSLKALFALLDNNQGQFISGKNRLLVQLRTALYNAGFVDANSGSEEDAHELLMTIIQRSGHTFSLQYPERIRPEEYNHLNLILPEQTANIPMQEIINLNGFRIVGTPPEFLPIQLGRFEYNQEDGTTRKIFTPIVPNKEIQIPGPTPNKNIRYRLVSAVTHYGDTPRTGHYTAAVLEPNNQFTCYDDASVATNAFDPTIEDIKQSGYLYFYERIK